MPFLHTKSNKLNYLTVAPTKSRSKETVINEIQRVTKMYKRRGFSVTKYHGDNEFECLHEFVNQTPVHIAARDKHVGIVEQSIRTMKERARCYCQNTPFCKVPKVMIDYLLELVNTNLNMYPAKTSVSETLSPAAIVMGTPKMEYNRLKLEYGAP